jgi:uncharacterized protein
LGFVIKRIVAPKLTKSKRIALKNFKLDTLYVVHAGEHSYPLNDRVNAFALGDIQKLKAS